MNHLDYIYTNKELLFANDTVEFKYTGYLKDIANNVTMHFGINNWQNVEDVPMIKNSNNEFIAEVKIPYNAKSINFSFKNDQDNWDNNYEENYTFDVLPQLINSDIEDTLNINFFEEDFMLKHNINKEIAMQEINNSEFTLSSNGEVIAKKSMNTEIEKFENELNKKLSEIKTVLFDTKETEQKNVLDILDSAFIEVDSVVNEELSSNLIYFYSKVPLVKNFKEAKVKDIQNIINNVENIEIEEAVSSEFKTTNEIIFTSKVNYAQKLRLIAKERALQEKLKENRALMVVPSYESLATFDQSVITFLKEVTQAFVRTIKGLKLFFAESLEFSESL